MPERADGFRIDCPGMTQRETLEQNFAMNSLKGNGYAEYYPMSVLGKPGQL